MVVRQRTCRLNRQTRIGGSAKPIRKKVTKKGPSVSATERQRRFSPIPTGMMEASRSNAPRLNMTAYSLFTHVPSGNRRSGGLLKSCSGHRFWLGISDQQTCSERYWLRVTVSSSASTAWQCRSSLWVGAGDSPTWASGRGRAHHAWAWIQSNRAAPLSTRIRQRSGTEACGARAQIPQEESKRQGWAASIAPRFYIR